MPKAAAAQTAGLPLEKVTVHTHLRGGGFGRRLAIDGVVRAVQIAQHVDGPVKVVWTREEDLQHDMYRPSYVDRLAAGLDEQGKPVAWKHRVTGASVTARWLPPAVKNGRDNDAVDGAAEPPYALPNILVEYVRQEPPGGMGEPGTAAVAPAITNASFAATGRRVRRLPIDPAQLRSTEVGVIRVGCDCWTSR